MNDTVWKLDYITGAEGRQTKQGEQHLTSLQPHSNQQVSHSITSQQRKSTFEHVPEKHLHLRETSESEQRDNQNYTRPPTTKQEQLISRYQLAKQHTMHLHSTSNMFVNYSNHKPSSIGGHFNKPLTFISNDQPKQPQLSSSRQIKLPAKECLNREVTIHSARSRQFDRHTISLLQRSTIDSNYRYSVHSQPWNIILYNRTNRASGQTHGSLSSVPEEMGKIESRNLLTDKDGDHTRIHGDISNKKFQSGFNIIHEGKSQPVVLNGNYKNGNYDKHNNSTKEKTKTKKLLTSRSPRTGIDHHQAIMYAQIKDTSFYDNDFRHRSMSESQAQLRKKVLERRLRMSGALDGNEDAPHRVTWADNLGSSLTCDSRRRSFSQGSTGLPNKPILKKMPHNDSDSPSEANSQSVLPVDTRYL
ncbi:hypothetical protein LOTGIDRAFT_174322 [Lottia gigantea]|uniref:Uncharacterized protein n=1 Tax=Lottia gigantea TaxID=225164 RepID=V4AX58_LOTGI|nr:hypothetical protein LOTGIDRAFT_174322 [Lottia gigantea]ESO98146.1 hypothetical protein LOTGIDRAFT_174322 [Lottia gigantea]